ncbi:MAG: hypothetical protein AAGE18_14920 [Pseudomonadota bacterium]
MAEPFFIGWAAPPRGLRRFLLLAALLLLGTFAGLGYALSVTQDDPGEGAFRFDWGRIAVTGVLVAEPYPVLHVLESPEHAPGTPLLLSAGGKRGVVAAASLDGRRVTVEGVALQRDAFEAFQVAGGRLTAAEGPAALPLTEPLGRWRITGEICDGKCYAGAMRPGIGRAHRGCANFCLLGGVPPIFLATDAVAGARIFLLAGPDGGPLDPGVLDYTALLVSLDGEVERQGALPVFRVETDSLRVVP